MSSYTELMTAGRDHEKRATENPNVELVDEMEAFGKAKECYEKALAAKPDDPRALYHIARCELVLSAVDDASSDDDDVDGTELERVAAVDRAIEKMRKALAGKPDFGECMFSLAEALIARADLNTELMEEGISITHGNVNDDDDADELVRKEAEKDLLEACDLFEKALPLFEPMVGKTNDDGDEVTASTLSNTLIGHAEALSSRAYLQEDSAKFEPLFDEAISKIAKAVEINPERKSELLQEWAGVLEARADKRVNPKHDAPVHEQTKPADYTEALAKLDEAFQADGKNAGALFDKAQLYMSLAHQNLMHAAVSMGDDEDKAEDAQEEYSEEVQKNVWDYFNQAKTTMEAAVEIEPETSTFTERLGDLCFTMGRLDVEIARASHAQHLADAEKWFRKTVALDEDDASAVARLAQAIFFLQGGEDGDGSRNKEVDELLEKYRELGGDLEDLMDDEETFEEEYVTRVSTLFPDQGWEDGSDSDDDDDE